MIKAEELMASLEQALNQVDKPEQEKEAELPKDLFLALQSVIDGEGKTVESAKADLSNFPSLNVVPFKVDKGVWIWPEGGDLRELK